MWVQELVMEQGRGTFDVQGNPRVIAMDKSDSRNPDYKWNLLRSYSNMGLSRWKQFIKTKQMKTHNYLLHAQVQKHKEEMLYWFGCEELYSQYSWLLTQRHEGSITGEMHTHDRSRWRWKLLFLIHGKTWKTKRNQTPKILLTEAKSFR